MIADRSSSEDAASDDVDGVLLALAEPTRRGVIDLLKERPHRAGELAEAFGMSPPAMSRHIRVLRRTGLIEDERTREDARVRMLRLRQEPFVLLHAWLDQVEAYWRDQLGSFKDHVEKKHPRRKR